MSSSSSGTGPQAKRGNTRQRIQEVALELFAEQGYEKTSLREIAERLEVTKAALYYHFKTKEDIIISVFEDRTRPVDELIEWAQEQPRTLETKREMLRRYSEAMVAGTQLYRFMHENQATMRELSIGEIVKKRIFTLVELLRTEDGPLADQVRCVSALFTLHAGMMFLQHVDEADPEATRLAALEVATDLITRAHGGQ
ncbi:TetR family transcriptional regulator [Streptomyces sp. 3211.6]|uniref:TetR/AcrR family transcriptional regulator n=1 Tax=Streptomyces TaxID=1883 RepID=UPI0009A5448F|nr:MULTISPECIES: TetR/AcrR family transcriptional regulator [Streptomyces]RKT06629.1 TetR family transcriptional regulator [Streptomyces sp. 3211.6]RPF45833.1 TetR family transcriptional regulator [Streptomyces sp. Ag109_G2-6]